MEAEEDPACHIRGHHRLVERLGMHVSNSLDGQANLFHQIRYGYLRVVSEEVILKWNNEDNSFTVSGKYGI